MAARPASSAAKIKGRGSAGGGGRAAYADESDACLGGDGQIERHTGAPVLQTPVRLVRSVQGQLVRCGSAKGDGTGLVHRIVDGVRQALGPAFEQLTCARGAT